MKSGFLLLLRQAFAAVDLRQKGHHSAQGQIKGKELVLHGARQNDQRAAEGQHRDSHTLPSAFDLPFFIKAVDGKIEYRVEQIADGDGDFRHIAVGK